ncbi:hypothetical protein VOLCADRAFT_105662 [Volvox carteri f. nagariensis]|uniref:Uncharacterized protein n=1 Tax=Volvox carteri f. nagariensis TaxID=3068 RepID=D8U271_VOLCA|nr:uncharacterized protein VOLCADRAFT_105662 [Volvox carteri f. nagariensis]EFJ46313.1 hypothetical protein VOLCADRAFT_105662 [Volvox carteri f. nagariensis]|eukprot:XP_002952760.1 hypothetical protein VOLCADRAFT_105662 [Volvox carteri f. nagariensis]
MRVQAASRRWVKTCLFCSRPPIDSAAGGHAQYGVQEGGNTQICGATRLPTTTGWLCLRANAHGRELTAPQPAPTASHSCSSTGSNPAGSYRGANCANCTCQPATGRRRQ